MFKIGVSHRLAEKFLTSGKNMIGQRHNVLLGRKEGLHPEPRFFYKALVTTKLVFLMLGEKYVIRNADKAPPCHCFYMVIVRTNSTFFLISSTFYCLSWGLIPAANALLILAAFVVTMVTMSVFRVKKIWYVHYSIAIFNTFSGTSKLFMANFDLMRMATI